jgi:hypothetical protein
MNLKQVQDDLEEFSMLVKLISRSKELGFGTFLTTSVFLLKICYGGVIVIDEMDIL